MKKIIFILLSFCFLNKLSLSAQTTSPFTEAFEKKIVQLLQKYKVPKTAIGFIADNKIIYTKVFSDSLSEAEIPKDLLFSVASLTKPITMMLTLTLVSKGMWDLDEPVAHYWIDPEVKNDSLVYKLTSMASPQSPGWFCKLAFHESQSPTEIRHCTRYEVQLFWRRF